MAKPTTISEYNAAIDGDMQEVAERLTDLIETNVVGLEGRLWQAQPVWLDGKTPVVGFKAFPRWVTLMIWNRPPDGAPAVADDSGTLESGPRMATRKFSRPDEIDEVLVAAWVQQATAPAASLG
jgi:hypothetical protein